MNVIYKYKQLLISHRFQPSSIRGQKFIVVIRLSKSGRIGMSKPCLGCATSMNNIRIKFNLNYIMYSNLIDNTSVLIRENIDILALDPDIQISSGDSRRRSPKKHK
jgi:hypothetical protein